MIERREHYVKTILGQFSYFADVSEYLSEQVVDKRSRSSAFRVFLTIFSHLEYNDCLPDGEPFSSVSISTIMAETGFSKNRVREAIGRLTRDNKPLEVVWFAAKGSGRGNCYRFNEVVADSARQRSEEWCERCVSAIVGLGEVPVDEPPDKGSETQPKGSETPTREQTHE